MIKIMIIYYWINILALEKSKLLKHFLSTLVDQEFEQPDKNNYFSVITNIRKSDVNYIKFIYVFKFVRFFKVTNN